MGKNKNSDWDEYTELQRDNDFVLGITIKWWIVIVLLIIATTLVGLMLRPTLLRWKTDYLKNETQVLQYEGSNEGGEWTELIASLELQNEALLEQMCAEAADINDVLNPVIVNFFKNSSASCAADYQ